MITQEAPTPTHWRDWVNSTLGMSGAASDGRATSQVSQQGVKPEYFVRRTINCLRWCRRVQFVNSRMNGGQHRIDLAKVVRKS